MATILLVWELGSGRGHLGPLRQVAGRLIERGHQVYLASRDVVAAGEIFAGTPVAVFAAPVLPATPSYAVSPVRSFLDILHNVGFGSREHLSALVAAWSSIYGAVRPDAIVFDHSPSALTASYAISAKRILLGIGFCCPPPGRERDDLSSGIARPRAQQASEPRVLENLNFVRKIQRLPPLDSVAELFANVDVHLLTTFPELDHFGPRPNGRYAGVFPLPAGAPPHWPRASRPRAFAYLKPHALLSRLVPELTRQQISTLLFTGSDDPAFLRRHSTEFVRVSPTALDLPAAIAEADFAILNGTHATTATALLAGKPSLHFPLVLEQGLLTSRVTQLKAGTLVAANRAETLSENLERVAAGEGGDGAATFAARYASFDREAALVAAVDEIESAIATS